VYAAVGSAARPVCADRRPQPQAARV